MSFVFGARFAEGAPDRTDAAAAAPLRDGDARAPQRLLPPHLRFKWWLALGDDCASAVPWRRLICCLMRRQAVVLYLNKGQLRVPRFCKIACRRTIYRLHRLWVHPRCAVVTRG